MCPFKGRHKLSFNYYFIIGITHDLIGRQFLADLLIHVLTDLYAEFMCVP